MSKEVKLSLRAALGREWIAPTVNEVPEGPNFVGLRQGDGNRRLYVSDASLPNMLTLFALNDRMSITEGIYKLLLIENMRTGPVAELLVNDDGDLIGARKIRDGWNAVNADPRDVETLGTYYLN